MAEIKEVSVKHESIMNHMLANPAQPLSEVAAHFGVTQPWLSTIIHSNAFQARLADKKEVLFGATILPLAEKLEGLAHTCVDRLHEQVVTTPSPAFVAEVTMSLLDRIGYTARSRGSVPLGVQQNIQNNYYTVDGAVLSSARARMEQRAERAQPELPELPERARQALVERVQPAVAEVQALEHNPSGLAP